MANVTLRALRGEAALGPFLIVLANACGLAGVRAGVGPVRTGGVWLGLLPADGPDEQLNTWAPAAFGPSFQLAAELAGSAGSVSAAWPSVGAAAPADAVRAIVTVPPAGVLVVDGGATAAAQEFASSLAASLARHFGVARRTASVQPQPVRPPAHAPAPTAAPRAPRAIAAVVDTAHLDATDDTDDPPVRPPRADRHRDGRQGSRTYDHPPWPVSEQTIRD